MSSSSWGQEPEAALKYLLFQAMGSTFILIGTLHPLISLFPLFGLCIKLGLAPIHFWFPSVIKRLNWVSAALLITWQKIAPITIMISFFSSYKSTLCLIGALSALIGGLGGFSQSHIRPLLAYSSIGHIGWIVSTSSFAPRIAIFYLIIYIFISIALIARVSLSNLNSIFQSSKPLYTPLIFLVLPCTLSLSGLPPFIGFFPKLFSLQSFSIYIIPLFLLLGSLLNLSYYLNFFFSLFFSSSKSFFSFYLNKVPFTTALIALLSIRPIPLIYIYALF